MSRPAAVLLVLLLAGCLGGRDDASTPAAPAEPLRVPVLDAVVLDPNFPGYEFEPSVRVDGDGRVYVSSPSGNLWRSDDGGRTYARLGTRTCSFEGAEAPGCAFEAYRTGLDTGGDGALAIDSRGTLYWAGLMGQAGAIPFQASHDRGGNWSAPIDLGGGRVADREWIVAGPHDELHLVWTDYGEALAPPPANLANFVVPGQARLVVRSSFDGGQAWTPARPITPPGSGPTAGPPAVDSRTGAIYVPAVSSLDGGVEVYRSADRGATWERSAVPSRTEPEATRAVPAQTYVIPWAAVDDAGAVYVAWSQDTVTPEPVPGLAAKAVAVPRVFLSVSRDAGVTWSPPRAVSPEGRGAVFPAVAAGAAGRIALAWYEAGLPFPTEMVPGPWFVALAEAEGADGPEPRFVHALTSAAPVHVGTICTQGLGCTAGDRTRGDFLDLALDARGQPLVAYIQDGGPPEDRAKALDVVVARVVDGTPLRPA